MKVKQNGAFVQLETEDDEEEMQSLRCVCGHRASDHFYSHTVGSMTMINIRGCKNCHCTQFKIKGKVETRELDYA